MKYLNGYIEVHAPNDSEEVRRKMKELKSILYQLDLKYKQEELERQKTISRLKHKNHHNKYTINS